MSKEQGYKRCAEDTKNISEMRNSFQTIETWVLCENSFKQLLVTHPVVLTEEGTN